MRRLWILYMVASLSVCLAVYLANLLHQPLINLCEVHKCPLCYGDTMCKDFTLGNIVLTFDNSIDFFYNMFSVKNVYFASYNSNKVVLKKLASEELFEEFDRVDTSNFEHNKHSVMHYLEQSFSNKSELKPFSVCNSDILRIFLTNLEGAFTWDQIYFMFKLGAEPMILHVFDSKATHWPFPMIHGACGRLIVEEYCGESLNSFRHSNWSLRAYLAMQLLEISVNITENHNDFRLYLTDISPDNIAVDGNFKVHFVDLENAILGGIVSEDTSCVHTTQHIAGENYEYSESDICECLISDHNLYAVCWLILSDEAPWPMMAGGLLHSAPENIQEQQKYISNLIKDCVDPHQGLSRFDIVEDLIEVLRNITDSRLSLVSS